MITMEPLRNTDAIRVGAGGDSPMGRMLHHPRHYQNLLGDVIMQEKPRVMIETGVESGYSTEWFLTSMDKVGIGHLFSCDPAPSGFYEANPIIHPRFTFMKEESYTALDKIFGQMGPIDLFLHDSCHTWECQTFEYEWAWGHVKSGGIIASDDTSWGMIIPVFGAIKHGAWDQFLARHGMTGRDVVIDNARWIRKP